MKSVIKTYLSKFTATLKIYDRLRRARAASWTQDRGIRHIAAKLFRIEGENGAGNLDDEGRNGGEYILSGKLSDPLEEAVNRYRNYRVTKSSALFIRLDNRDNSVQVQM